jgi:hypothetical protein
MDIIRISFFGVESRFSWVAGAKNMRINLNLIRLRIILLIALHRSGQNNDFLKYFRTFIFSDFLLKILVT